MSRIDKWMKVNSSDSPEIRRRAAITILDRSDTAPLDVLIEILQSLGHQRLGSMAEKALLNRNDADLVHNSPKCETIFRLPFG